MRADRLVSLVLLLQKHRQMRAEELAQTLGVTERTIYRDIEALSSAGVPVFTRSGPAGGCFLDEDYRSRLNWFTPTELQALLYTGSASPLSELGMQQSMDNAVLKLLALLPDRHKRQAEQMQQRLYLEPTGWYGSTESHNALPLIKEAVWNDLEIEAVYETWEGQHKNLRLAPYSLVYKADRWYVVAMNKESGQMRVYRVARLSEVQITDTRFERDPEFDIVAYWAESSANFLGGLPSYPVMLRVRPTTMIYFGHIFEGRHEVIEQGDDWWVLRVDYMVFEEARTSVLGLGTDAEVIEPPELGQAVVEMARAIVEKRG
jgi:predicted DNA-binding transcriptional regulator YafY